MAAGPLSTSFRQRLLAVLQGEPLISAIVVAGITVGFFHGWLKLNYSNPITTFLFDAVLLLALGLAYLRHPRNQPFIPRGPIGRALLAFYGVCLAFALVPWGPPWLVSVAAMRGWCFATLMYALGYQMTRSLNQVKAFFYVVIILGVITAVYGIRQSPEEVARRMQQDETYARRLMGTYYYTSSGKSQLRVFSTFVTSGVFGGVMAYVIIFAVALASDSEVKRTERGMLMAAIAVMTYALVLTGARSALISMGVGFAIAAWHRRRFEVSLLIPLIVYVAFRWASARTEGAAMERFGTIADVDTVSSRFWIPVVIAFNEFMEYPLGGGLGKSGYSVPFIMYGRTGYTDFRPGEGDLTCLVIEMGVLGLILFVRLLGVTLVMVYRGLNQLRATPSSTVALACAACSVLATVVFPIGSPFLSVPTGALTWFFIGTLQRLVTQHQSQEAAVSTVPPPSPPEPPPTLPPYRRPKRVPAPRGIPPLPQA